MALQKKLLFNNMDVEWILDRISLLKSNSIDSFLRFFLPRLAKVLNYAQHPLLKILKNYRQIIQFFGLEPLDYEVVRLKEYLLPTSLGGYLATDIYLPKPVFKERYKAPTLLIRLPYWKDLVNILGFLFASMGYCTILQDTRGCAHSKPHGTNSFLMFEGIDGLDTLRWIKKRFWYNGRIGMWGMSYFGITQLAVAANITEEDAGLVTCLNPGMCSYHNIFYHPYGLIPLGMGASVYAVFHSITKYYELESLSEMFKDPKQIPLRLSKYPQLNLYNEKIGEPRWVLHFDDLAKLENPKEMIETINMKLNLNLKIDAADTGEFQKLLEAVIYTRRLNPQSLFFPHAIGFNFKPHIPMLFIAGHYDMFQEEFWRDVLQFQQADPNSFRKYFKAIIGPWAHGGMDMTFNDKGRINLKTNMKDLVEMSRSFMPMWYFQHFLKRGGKDIHKIPTFQIYILNRKIWRFFNWWPPKGKELKLYLHSDGLANTRFGSGVLSIKPPVEEPFDEYEFDPLNPVPTQGGRHLFFVSGPHDQSKVEKRPDILCYTTPKLTEGLEIIGEVKLVLYASSTAKEGETVEVCDTDFMAKLVDVFPNGKKAYNIVDDGVRARFREGDLEHPTLIKPGKIYQYTFSLGNTAIYFPTGHQIRLEISSSNFPKFDINSNLGGTSTKKGYVIAHQTIYHDQQYPSHLILPVFKKG
ncbi:MAG: CocE/NonD family hydrolase [Candidatus Helarchaeota archaeon]